MSRKEPTPSSISPKLNPELVEWMRKYSPEAIAAELVNVQPMSNSIMKLLEAVFLEASKHDLFEQTSSTINIIIDTSEK